MGVRGRRGAEDRRSCIFSAWVLGWRLNHGRLARFRIGKTGGNDCASRSWTWSTTHKQRINDAFRSDECDAPTTSYTAVNDVPELAAAGGASADVVTEVEAVPFCEAD